MTITDDEREAREWLEKVMARGDMPSVKRARTILALLDAPRLPHPDDLTYDLMDRMECAQRAAKILSMRAAYRALYDHYNAPPQPKKVEAWAVVDAAENRVMCPTEADALAVLRRHPGSRIVKLVEAADE